MSDEKNKWLDRTLIPALPWLTVEVMFFAVIVLLAFVTRFYDLGTRVMSHDESLHTFFSYEFSQGKGYQHNPMMHGPLQFHMVALSYFIFGANDFTARIPAVLFSIATVWILWYWRRYLGRAGVIAAGIMMLLSPYMLYYGRYVRNESFVALFGVLTLYAVLRYLETGLPRYIYMLVAATVLHFTVKETSFIYTALLLVFLAGYLIAQITRRPWENAEGDFKGFIASLLIGAVAIGSALLVQVAKGKQTLDSGQPISPAVPGQGASPLSPIDTGLSPVLILGLIGLAALGVALFLVIRGYGLEKIRLERSFDMAMVIGTLILPMLGAFPMEWLSPYTQNWFGIPIAIPIEATDLNTFGISSIILMMILLAVIVGFAIWLGLFWNKNLWWKSALLFYSIFTVFYTTLFTNGGGLFTGLLGSLGYWIEQQGVERGSQPLYYYALIQVPIYEYLPLLATIFAFIIGARRLQQAREQNDAVSVNLPNTFALLGWWSFGSLAAFSLAGERMPWLTVHITLPFILFGGWAIGSVIEHIDWEELRRRNALLILAVVTIFVISILGIFISLLGSPRPFQGTELGQLQATTSFIFSVIGALASGFALFRLLDEWDIKQAASLAVLAFFGIFAILTARTTIRANYINYDSGKEYLVYAHSYTGVKQVLEEVKALSLRTVGTPYDIVVAYDDDVSWPVSWYMIDFPNARYYGASPDMSLREVPAIIVGDNNFAKIEPIVGENYYRFDYVRMVWPNQDYFNLVSERLDPNEPFPDDYACSGVLSVFKLFKSKDYARLCNGIGNPEMRAAIFDIWLNRDYKRYSQLTGNTGLVDSNWDPSDRMRLYIRKDVADLVWNYGIKAAELQPDPYAEGMTTLAADQIFGMTGSEPGQFNAPRGVALAPDGSLYVADSRNHRLQHLTSDGQVLKVWGTFADLNSGEAPLGTFNEPWGVAVGPDGSVYVTDTWNHRVQKFNKDGIPLKQWGIFGLADTPGALYGPRGIAVDKQGRIFVADTGNKRIVIFDSNGAVLGQFGGEGAEAGQFYEPVDVKLDANGNAYVTDTWNQRIQMLSPLEDGLTYIPVSQWPVRGWRSDTLENKPYIAVSESGNVFITDPESFRVIEFNQNGEFVQLWGTYGNGPENFGLPSGITIDNDGHVWITDAGNGRVMRFTVP